MDGFNEQVVKKAKSTKDLLVKIISVLTLITLPVICVLLASYIPYLVFVAFFILVGGIYLVWYIFHMLKVDYEYSINGDHLVVAKIIDLRARKLVCKVPIREIEKLEIGEKSIETMRFSKSFTAARDINCDNENYYLVYNNAAYGRCLLVFSPNEKILQAMKPYLNKEIVLKLFYNRNVG